MADLPEGFVIDAAAPQGGALPDGFVVDAADAAKPGDFTPNERVMSAFDVLKNPANADLKGRPFVPNEAAGAAGAGLLKSLGTGLARGAEYGAGLPGDFQNLTGLLGDKIAAKLGEDQAQIAADRARVNGSVFNLPTSDKIIDAETQATGGLHQATTPAERMTESFGSLLTPVAGGSVADAARFAALPAAASEGAGAATHGMKVGGVDLEPWARGIASVVAPAVAPRIISPLRAPNAGHVQDIDALAAEGVPVTAGQRTDSTRLKYLESELSSGRNAEQAEAFTRAAGQRIGMNAPYLRGGPAGNFTTRLNQIQSRFDTLGQSGTLHADPALLGDMQSDYNSVHAIPGIHAQSARDAAQGAIRSISDALHATGGTIAGPDYQVLRSRLNDAAMAADNPGHARVLRDVVESLDDAFERSNPQIAGQFGEARRDYRNALVLEDALTKQGEAGARGTVTPSALQASAKKVYGRRAYLKGNDDFSELSRPAVASLTPLPNSGTAPRTRVNDMITGVSALLGAGGGHLMGAGTEGAVLGLLAAEKAPHVVEPFVRPMIKGAVMNPLTQLYLGNQAAARMPGLLSTLPGLNLPIAAARQSGN